MTTRPATAKGVEPRDAREVVAELVESHGPRLRGAMQKLCGNDADADEVVQEAFLQAFRRWSTFEGRSDPSPWLYTIAVRIWRRKYLKKKKQGRVMPAFSQLLPFGDTTIADISLGRNEPLENLIEAEAVEAVQAAIPKLPPLFRLPLVLKDIAEMSLADVASVLSIKPETAKTRVHRARLMLRRAMMSCTAQRAAPAPIYERSVCFDLLRAKLDAMDRGIETHLPRDVICERCRAVFRELDMTQYACAEIAKGRMPDRLRRAIMSQAAQENARAKRTHSAEGRSKRRARG